MHLADLQMEYQKKQRDNRSNKQQHKNEDIKKLNQNYIRTAIALMHIKQVQPHVNIRVNAHVYNSQSGVHAYTNPHYDFTEQKTPIHHADWDNQTSYTNIRDLLSQIKRTIQPKNIDNFADIKKTIYKYDDINGSIKTVYDSLRQIQYSSNEKQNENEINHIIEFMDIHINIYNILHEIHRILTEEKGMDQINELLVEAHTLSKKYNGTKMNQNIVTITSEWKFIVNTKTKYPEFKSKIENMYKLSYRAEPEYLDS